jgi:hypothetical protein
MDRDARFAEDSCNKQKVLPKSLLLRVTRHRSLVLETDPFVIISASVQKWPLEPMKGLPMMSTFEFVKIGVYRNMVLKYLDNHGLSSAYAGQTG